jgi:3-hydroxyisobutyrate dehydrogenase-like beta-hydroxyacid dehydrogenase
VRRRQGAGGYRCIAVHSVLGGHREGSRDPSIDGKGRARHESRVITCQFSPALAREDIRLAIDLAEESGVGVPIWPATDALLSTVIDAGGDWPDFAAVIEALS